MELDVEGQPIAAPTPMPETTTERDEPAEEPEALNPTPDSDPQRSTRNRQEPDWYGYKLAFTLLL